MMATDQVDSQDMFDLAHDWNSTHKAWDYGNYDNWIGAKGEMTMAYFDQPDIPFHRALAGAYTICDNYHCSVMGPTTPNRLYLGPGRSIHKATRVGRPPGTPVTISPSTPGRRIPSACRRRASRGRSIPTTKSATTALTHSRATTGTTRCGCSRRITTHWRRAIPTIHQLA